MKAKVMLYFAADMTYHDQSVESDLIDGILKDCVDKLRFRMNFDEVRVSAPLQLTQRDVLSQCKEKRDIVALLRKNKAKATRSSVRLLRSLRVAHIRTQGLEDSSFFDNYSSGYSINIVTGVCSSALVAKRDTSFASGWAEGIKDLPRPFTDAWQRFL